MTEPQRLPVDGGTKQQRDSGTKPLPIPKASEHMRPEEAPDALHTPLTPDTGGDRRERSHVPRRSVLARTADLDDLAREHGPKTAEGGSLETSRSVVTMSDELRRCLQTGDEPGAEPTLFEDKEAAPMIPAGEGDKDTLDAICAGLDPSRTKKSPSSGDSSERDPMRGSTRTRTMSLYEMHAPNVL